MPVTKKIEVNGDALRAEIFKRNMSLAEASRAIGYADSYMNCVIHRGSISENKPQMIEKILGIRPEKYVVQETQLEIKPEPSEIKIDGNMVRNIDVEFIRFRAHEIGLPLKSFCDVMGKRDNYLFNLRTNGATKDDFERIKVILRLEADDDRLIRKSQPIEAAPADTVEDIKVTLHKHEAKIASLQTEIKRLKSMLESNKPM